MTHGKEAPVLNPFHRRWGRGILSLLGLLSGLLPGLAAAAPVPQGAVDPANFVSQVDNPYFPLTPGTTWIYEGTRDGHAQRAVVTVTGATKTILGVPCLVIQDDVTEEGQIVEQTEDWYAQDKAGNVWYFGESFKERLDDGSFSTQGSWLAGVDGVQPGIIMEAQPRLGDGYNQEQASGVAEDKARVIGLNESVAVRYGAFRDVLVTEEYTPLEPGYVEHKYYAPGIGNVLILATAGGQERMELVRVTTTAPGMPRTGGAGDPINLWAVLVFMGGLLGVAGGLAVRRAVGRR
jgi:hypothetical protein